MLCYIPLRDTVSLILAKYYTCTWIYYSKVNCRLLLFLRVYDQEFFFGGECKCQWTNKKGRRTT